LVENKEFLIKKSQHLNSSALKIKKIQALTKGVPNAGDFLIGQQVLPLGSSLSGDKDAGPELPHWAHPQPLATMVDENEAVAHRQPVLGRRLLDNMEIRG